MGVPIEPAIETVIKKDTNKRFFTLQGRKITPNIEINYGRYVTFDDFVRFNIMDVRRHSFDFDNEYLSLKGKIKSLFANGNIKKEMLPTLSGNISSRISIVFATDLTRTADDESNPRLLWDKLGLDVNFDDINNSSGFERELKKRVVRLQYPIDSIRYSLPTVPDAGNHLRWRPSTENLSGYSVSTKSIEKDPLNASKGYPEWVHEPFKASSLRSVKLLEKGFI
jgi:hypothetical protein